MALVQDIKDGNVIGDKYNKNTETTLNKGKTADDTKQMFLKLLVTEMQYQDPLQPTDNSEYVKEMATFSQVEAVNGIKTDMTGMQANTLVGQCVTVLDENDKELTGIVDYVTKDNPPMLSIEGNLYSIDSVQAVQEASYFEATTLSDSFKGMIDMLPNESYLTISDKSDVEAAANCYDSMTDYQKTFVPEDYVKRLTALVTKLNAMLKTQEETEAKAREEKEAAESAAAATGTATTEASADTSATADTAATAVSAGTATTATAGETASSDTGTTTDTAAAGTAGV